VAGRVEAMVPERELEQAGRLGIRFVIPSDDEWPRQLDGLAAVEPLQNRGGMPLGLWVKGPLRLDELATSVAVVGSRSATSYGGDVAADLAAVVARAGHAVVSGAAFGIDQAAHRGALAAGGRSVAVLACGVDRAYPMAHKRLLDHLGAEGAVVSEVPIGCSPTRLRFLARNRLIAALTRGTVVVEAAVRSGALNTANWASLCNRVLMGVPGPVTSAPSEGVHELLRAKDAALVTRGSDVLELVAPSGSFTQGPRRGPDRPADRLSETDRQVLDAVPVARPADAPALARTAGVAESTVRAALERLRDGGFVEAGPAGWRLSSTGAGADA
jgi:DNA processing protein